MGPALHLSLDSQSQMPVEVRMAACPIYPEPLLLRLLRHGTAILTTHLSLICTPAMQDVHPCIPRQARSSLRMPSTSPASYLLHLCATMLYTNQGACMQAVPSLRLNLDSQTQLPESQQVGLCQWHA